MTSFNNGIEAAADRVRHGIAITQAAMDRNGPDRWAYAVDALKDAVDAIEDLKRPEPGEDLPADVRRLVIAARIVVFEDQSPEAIKELDKASEAFADRVPWDDEPGFGETEPSEADLARSQLNRVQEELKEGRGFWRTCSGCHETSDGYDVGHYPHSKVFNCTVGGGCGDCGGLGVVWDNIDYEDMARFVAEEPSEDERVEKVAAVIERELMIDEMLLADPATLRKIKSQRIARAALKAMEGE